MLWLDASRPPIEFTTSCLYSLPFGETQVPILSMHPFISLLIFILNITHFSTYKFNFFQSLPWPAITRFYGRELEPAEYT